MTDAKQTKCPHCGSTFRISDAQLAAKGGSVRCGSCLQVFRADLHLVGAAPAAKPAAPAPAPAAPATPAAKPKKKGGPADESWALNLLGEEGGAQSGDDWKLPDGKSEPNDDFGFSDDDINDFMAKGASTPAEAAPGKSILFDDELSDQLESASEGFTAPEEETHRISENADESWAQEILSELETEEQKETKKQYSMEIVGGNTKPPPKNPKLAAAIGAAPQAGQPAPAARKTAPPPAPAPAPADDFLGDDADVLSFLDTDDLSQPAGPAPAAPPTANPFSLDRPLAHVDAPVELKPRRDPIRWGYLITWTFFCLFAAAMLTAQYIYFNFESLAIKPAIRPLFEQACNKLGCVVPEIPDPSKLRVEELVVRKHATVQGALVVDAILKNNASFPQPFPMLRLQFGNAADEIIASRLLKPVEYLQGEARLLRRIPPDTPVHISLEIIDPGKDAVSYSMEPVL